MSVYSLRERKKKPFGGQRDDGEEKLPNAQQAAGVSALAFAVGGALPLLVGGFIGLHWVQMGVVLAVSSLELAGLRVAEAVLGGSPMAISTVRGVVGGWAATMRSNRSGKTKIIYFFQCKKKKFRALIRAIARAATPPSAPGANDGLVSVSSLMLGRERKKKPFGGQADDSEEYLPNALQAPGVSTLAFAVGGVLPLLAGGFIGLRWVRMGVVLVRSSLELAGLREGAEPRFSLGAGRQSDFWIRVGPN
ncbi:hypothetical protein EJ110_NYTH16584 [Nymphaea thermarum]|nr:hypothetical protein EJ110_NYTH16584 [Nymphaea thermarum]